MIKDIHHTSFTVSNLEKAEWFFTTLLGMKRIGGGFYDFDYIRSTVAIPGAVLKISLLALPWENEGASSHLVELIEYCEAGGEETDTATNRPGNAHLCFTVDDIDGEYERLKSHGVKFKSTPNEVAWGGNKGARSVYFNGPDGIALEFLQPCRPPTAPNFPATTSTATSI